MDRPNESPTPEGARKRPQFESQRQMLLYLFVRMRHTNRWWLLPALLVAMLLGSLLNIFTGHNVLPAIYSLIP